MEQEKCVVIITDKAISTPYSTYWVVEAGKNPDYKYPCVMVDVVREIAELVGEGRELELIDKTSKKKDLGW